MRNFLLMTLLATTLTGCSRRRKWDDSLAACPTGGDAYSYYFGNAPEGRWCKKFESPEAAAAAARADHCDVQRALLQSVVACCR
jgi:hypothetical protein